MNVYRAMVTYDHGSETYSTIVENIRASSTKEAGAKAVKIIRARFPSGKKFSAFDEGPPALVSKGSSARSSMTRKLKKHAGNFARRGTGHIHPAGPRKCPKCGV